jgi:hypothetical protein
LPRPQDCIALARSIAAAEGVDAGGLVAFHPLDLLAHESALAFLQGRAKATIAARQESSSGDDITCVVIFLYVYPTLLTRLEGLISDLVRCLSPPPPPSSSSSSVLVLTLTYHFGDGALPGLVRSAEGGGRFVVYTHQPA